VANKVIDSLANR